MRSKKLLFAMLALPKKKEREAGGGEKERNESGKLPFGIRFVHGGSWYFIPFFSAAARFSFLPLLLLVPRANERGREKSEYDFLTSSKLGGNFWGLQEHEDLSLLFVLLEPRIANNNRQAPSSEGEGGKVITR
jgi:hypothetical protein